jgi:Effector-associated domain 1/TIR domain
MPDLELDGGGMSRFKDALVAAFPTWDALAQMVRFGLGENLDALVAQRGLGNAVFELITWAEARGSLTALLDAALAANAGNPRLRAFAGEHGRAVAPSQAAKPAAAPPPVAPQASPPSPASPVITKRAVRNLLNAMLRSDSDLNAFTLDFFEDVHGRFTNAMDRVAKVDLLLLHATLPSIVEALREGDPGGFTQLAGSLGGALAAQAVAPAQPTAAAPPAASPPVAAGSRASSSSTAGEASWDLFLAHAGGDAKPAEDLYALLSGTCRVFLDKKSVLLGDDWDLAIARAQQASRITVVLVSSKYPGAYYLREEIALAIAMARRDAEAHRVVPVFLDGLPTDAGGIPYGLRLKNGIDAVAVGGMPAVAAELAKLLGELAGKPLPPLRALPPVSHDRVDLHDALCKMMPPQFETTLFRTGAPPAQLSPPLAPQATRAIDLVLYMEQLGPGGLDKLAQAIKKVAPHLLP